MKRLRRLLRAFFGFCNNHREGVALTLVIALAALFRLWQLNHLPPGLHPDEAANGLDIIERIRHGDLRVLYDTNGPRESLFFFLQAIFVFTLGNTILALRLAPALIGIGAVVATYFLCRQWFSKRTALLASLVMASGSWAVTMSRNGFRASLIPLMIPLTLWLFTKAIKQRGLLWPALAGISLGAGFYTYLNWRFVPGIALIILVFALVTQRTVLKQSWKSLLVAAVMAGLVLIPLGLYGLKHPADVLGGRSSVSFTNPELNHGQPLRTLATTAAQTALMFNVSGDANYRHNLGKLPMLNGFVGVMFLLGGLLALRRWRDPRYFTLLVIFAVMLLPELLTAEGIPHGLRAIGVIPTVYIFGAIGISELLSRWRGVFPRNVAAMSAAALIILLLLVGSTFYDYQRYFVAWANDPQTFEAYSEDSVAVADYLLKHDFAVKPQVVIDGYSDKTVQYLTHRQRDYQRLEGEQLTQLPPERPLQIVVANSRHHSAAASLSTLKAKLIHTGNSPHRSTTVLYRVYELPQTP